MYICHESKLGSSTSCRFRDIRDYILRKPFTSLASIMAIVGDDNGPLGGVSSPAAAPVKLAVDAKVDAEMDADVPAAAKANKAKLAVDAGVDSGPGVNSGIERWTLAWAFEVFPKTLAC